MKGLGFATILDIIQTTIISLSFIGLVWQLGQFNKNLRHSAMARDVDYYIRVNEWLLERPDIATMLYSKDSDFARLNKSEKDMYNYLALLFGFFEHLFLLRKEKITSRQEWEVWEGWLNTQIYSNPCFDVYWRNEEYAFREPFRKYINTNYNIHKMKFQDLISDRTTKQGKLKNKKAKSR